MLVVTHFHYLETVIDFLVVTFIHAGGNRDLDILYNIEYLIQWVWPRL